MPRIDPRLIERLHAKIGVARSQLYKLIDKTSREMHIPRHFAAIALAASRGINIQRFARDDYYAAIRGASAGHPADAVPLAPPPARREGRAGAASRGKARRAGRFVFVVHGRDEALRRSIFDFLRALGLQPIEWSKARAMTGKPNPVVSEILDSAFAKAVAVVVVLSPDDEARLAARFVKPHDPPQCLQIILFKSIQTNNVGNADPIGIMAKLLYRISGPNLAFSQNRKIESAPTADEKSLDHISSPKLEGELGARYAGFGHHYLRPSNAKAVADVDFFL